MKKVWSIFTNDVKNIRTNWVAAVIICGLIILPSLYAWFNIRASWDPYSQTDQIPVGIVNEDNGANIRDETINVGEELIETLKSNDSFDWHFVDYEEAMDKVNYGDFYAVIVIPNDFSDRLSTVIKSKPKKANIEYYVNEKINAISPKITEKGASVIVEQISSNFISTVNGVIFNVFNEIGLEIEQELPDIKKVEQYVFDIEERLPVIYETLNHSLDDATSALDVVHKAQNLLPDVQNVTNTGINTVDDLIAFLSSAEDRLNKVTPRISNGIDKIQKKVDETNQLIDKIQNSDVTDNFSSEIKNLEQKINDTKQTISLIEKALKRFENIEGDNGQNEQIKHILNTLTDLKEELDTLDINIEKIESFYADNEEKIKDYVKNIQDIATDIHDKTDALTKEYKETVEPVILENIDNLKNTLTSARGIIEDIQETIPEVEQILNRTEKTLNEGESTIEDVLNEYPFMNDKVTELANRIRKAKEKTNIDEIIELLKNDPEAEKSFFAEPVLLKENRVFPVQNYGTGMTPFYTVLAVWVGAVLLISLLSVDINHVENYSTRHIYFGRLLTFLTIAILQTIIVTIGDVTIIGVDASSPISFILFGLIISIVFMTIIYTLVSVFGDVGKAIAIILLVLQIAGSGGTYPVVLLPEFFQSIHPVLPFTYAVDLMREAVGGIVWERAIKNISILIGMGLLFVLFAIFAKESFNKRSKKLMEKSKEAGLFD